MPYTVLVCGHSPIYGSITNVCICVVGRRTAETRRTWADYGWK